MSPPHNATANRLYRRPPRRPVAILSVVIGIAISLLDFPAAAEDASKPSAPAAASSAPYQFTNRLIDSNDPYLLLHAHNPVDWYPWGPEAFAKAKKENKPIFLSIGYSTCYWCHVAERTIYSNPEIATLMNQRFINVKVDSEQRPDVDRIYMLARQLMTAVADGRTIYFSLLISSRSMQEATFRPGTIPRPARDSLRFSRKSIECGKPIALRR
jgi:Protein of unknown function, DUF255